LILFLDSGDRVLVGFKLTIFLPQPPESWNYRHVSPCPARPSLLTKAPTGNRDNRGNYITDGNL
jgi:hypothetical protein